MKPFIISHGGDIDGASPVILCNMVFGHVDYALVEVQTGQYESYRGYVNSEYITPLGESTIRVGTEE